MNDRTVDQAIEAAILANGLTVRARQSDWWARLMDETLFMYLSGSRGVNADFIEETSFTVTGESACASPSNFDAEIGRKIARENAIRKVWPLLGYELRSKLAAGGEA